MIDSRPKKWSHPYRFKTTTAKKRIHFDPMNTSNIGIYVCGPTPHARAHLGNLRTAVSFDILFRALRHTYGDNNITYVSNYTDIDDKIIAAHEQTGASIKKITDTNISLYEQDLKSLNCLEPTHRPRVSEYISQIVAQIQQMLKDGRAYENKSHIYFDTSLVEQQPLSKRKLTNNKSTREIKSTSFKKSPNDFVLWKPDPEYGFNTVLGKGRPGWHQECVVMSQDLLGDHFDIHGGGIDLLHPHHDCECLLTKSGNPAKMWLHSEMIKIKSPDGKVEKMSKSLNNVVDMDTLVEYDPLLVRWTLLQTHWQKPLEWSTELIDRQEKIFKKFTSCYEPPHRNHTNLIETSAMEPLYDNLNTPLLMAKLHEFHKNGQWMKISTLLEIIGITPNLIIQSELDDDFDPPPRYA